MLSRSQNGVDTPSTSVRTKIKRKKHNGNSKETLQKSDDFLSLSSTEALTRAELQKIFDGISPKINRLGVPIYLCDTKPPEANSDQMQNFLKLQHNISGALSPLTLEVLKTTTSYLNKIIKEQKELKNIIKLQSIIRGWLIRKQMTTVKPYLNTLMNIKVIFCDFVKTERQYIKDLTSIINTYLVPCRAKANHTDDYTDIAAVFSNIETILAVHQILFRGISHIQEFRWPFFNGLGTLFLNHASEFKSYGDYAENCTTSRITYSKIINNKKHKFKEVFECGDSPGKLENLLLLPLQRVTKYADVLGSFLMYSSGIEIDELDLLSSAKAIMTNIKTLVSKKLELADRYAENLAVQRSLSLETPVELHNGTRFLVHSGAIYSTTLKKIHYFLFNDILVLAKAQGERFKLLYKINLVNASMNASEGGLYELRFGSEKIEFRTDKALEELERIQKQIFKHKKTGVVFGIRLEQILRFEKRDLENGGNCIPKIIEFIINYLKRNALDTEGILRIAGNFDRIEKLKMQLDNSSLENYDSINLQEYSEHDIGGLLGMYLRELPVPLVPFEFYEPLMNIQRNGDLIIFDRVSQIKKILDQIPKEYFMLLKYLIEFSLLLESHSDKNKMSISNLAIIFGPNLIRSEVETVQYALEMPLVNCIVQIFLEHCDCLFDIPVSKTLEISRQSSRLIVGSDLKVSLSNTPPRIMPNQESEIKPKISNKVRNAMKVFEPQNNNIPLKQSPKLNIKSPTRPVRLSPKVPSQTIRRASVATKSDVGKHKRSNSSTPSKKNRTASSGNILSPSKNVLKMDFSHYAPDKTVKSPIGKEPKKKSIKKKIFTKDKDK